MIRQITHRRTAARNAAMLLTCVCLALLLAGCQSAINLRDEGVLALRRGQNQLAVQKLTQSVELDESSARSRYQLGRAYLAVNENIKAQYELEKAYALAPDEDDLTPDILDHLAEALYRQDRTASLFAFLEKQTSQTPTTRDYLRQGKYFAMAGDPDAARLAYRKATYFADPKDVRPYVAIADFYTSIGDEPNAVLALRYANYVAPGNLDVAERLRKFGIVPGPTITEAPPKPALLR